MTQRGVRATFFQPRYALCSNTQALPGIVFGWHFGIHVHKAIGIGDNICRNLVDDLIYMDKCSIALVGVC